MSKKDKKIGIIMGIALIFVLAFIANASENATLDENNNRSILGVDSAGETKRLVADDNGQLKIVDSASGAILQDIEDNQTDGTQKTQNVDASGNVLTYYADEQGRYYANVHDGHPHNVLINRHFVDFDSSTENPSSAISSGDRTILVASTTGFIVGDHIVIKDASGDIREHHFDITAVVADTSITVNRPIDNAYTTSAVLEEVEIDMNVDGSGTAVIYDLKPPSDEVWHINRILFDCENDVAVDSADFCGETLTNGIVIRQNRSIGIQTLSVWKTTGEMAEDMYDVDYPTKVPAGVYAVKGRWTFENADVVLRLDGAQGDSAQVIIQDDATGMTKLRIKGQGHIE